MARLGWAGPRLGRPAHHPRAHPMQYALPCGDLPWLAAAAVACSGYRLQCSLYGGAGSVTGATLSALVTAPRPTAAGNPPTPSPVPGHHRVDDGRPCPGLTRAEPSQAGLPRSSHVLRNRKSTLPRAERSRTTALHCTTGTALLALALNRLLHQKGRSWVWGPPGQRFIGFEMR